jgi:hypothetical protein
MRGRLRAELFWGTLLVETVEGRRGYGRREKERKTGFFRPFSIPGSDPICVYLRNFTTKSQKSKKFFVINPAFLRVTPLFFVLLCGFPCHKAPDLPFFL